MATKLTPKQKTFVKGYLETGNGTEAALKAYDIQSPNAENVAHSIASENLRKPAIQSAIHEALPDDLLAKKHLSLLNTTRIEHMTFPLGPANQDEPNFSGARPNEKQTTEAEMPEYEKRKQRTTLSDTQIVKLLADVNCQVKQIVHGEQARHVYYWAADAQAQVKALEMAYKVKGTFAPDKHANLNMHMNLSTDPSDIDLDKLVEEAESKLKSQKTNE